MAECFVCQNGPPDGSTVYRVNETGVEGVWACREHLPPSVVVDPQVQGIVDAIEYPDNCVDCGTPIKHQKRRCPDCWDARLDAINARDRAKKGQL